MEKVLATMPDPIIQDLQFWPKPYYAILHGFSINSQVAAPGVVF